MFTYRQKFKPESVSFQMQTTLVIFDHNQNSTAGVHEGNYEQKHIRRKATTQKARLVQKKVETRDQG